MKIDDRIEQRVRETLHWVVKRDINELERSINALSDERSRRAALELLMAIIGFVIIDSYGRKPSPEELDLLAEEIAKMEHWILVPAGEISTLLRNVLSGESLAESLSPESMLVLPYVVAGSLLSAQPKSKGEWWFNYLDKVEAAIEAAG